MGRFVIICAILSGLLFVGYRVALERNDIQIGLYNRVTAARMEAAAPFAAELDAITARPCVDAPCLMVQASGREFLVGAGEGAAQGLFAMGALNARLDGVLLTELSRGQIEGLLGVRDRTLEAGRRDMLKVYGPSGVERLVEGVNAMLETSDADRALHYSEGLLPFSAAPVAAADMGDFEDGRTVFDSGVLSIRIYNVASGRASSDALIYRFDQDDRALIVGGCRVRAEDVRLALGDAPPARWALVLPLASERMLGVQRDQADAAGLGRAARFINAPADECLTVAAFAELLKEVDAPSALAWPLFPAPKTSLDARLWRGEIDAIRETGANAWSGRGAQAFILGPGSSSVDIAD